MLFTENQRAPARLNGSRSPVARRRSIRLLLTVLTVCTIARLHPAAQAADPGPPAAGDPVVLAVVNGDTITSADLDAALIATHRTMAETERREFDYRGLLTKLINDRLLIQEAVTLEMDQEPQLVTKLRAQSDKQAITLWVRDHFQPEIQIPEDVIREFFRTKFWRAQLRMVTVRTSDLVQQICRDIRAGADMDSIARAQSVDSYRTQGGLQKSKYGIDLELTLRNLADTLPVGTVSDPFPYRSVYAVARIERKIPADAGEFDSLKSGIESQLKRLEYSSQWELFLTGLKDRFGYALDSAALTAIRADSADLYTPDFTIGTDNVVIRLGEKTRVTDAELRKKIGRAAMTGGGMPFVELLERTVAEITQDLVLTAVAYDDGYDELPAVRKEYNRTLDSALVETYLEEIVAPRIVFRRAEFETYYQEHLQDFKRPDRLRFDRLVVDSEAVALEIFERLADGADFRYVSEQYDLDASSAEESAEWLPITSFPDHLRADIDQLRIGACLPPQRIDKGWLILRLKARQPGEVMGIEEVEPRIRSTLFQQKFDAELDSVLLLLKENSDIEYNDEAIEEYFGDGS